jgi:hypothetical protein
MTNKNVFRFSCFFRFFQLKRLSGKKIDRKSRGEGIYEGCKLVGFVEICTAYKSGKLTSDQKNGPPPKIIRRPYNFNILQEVIRRN